MVSSRTLATERCTGHLKGEGMAANDSSQTLPSSRPARECLSADGLSDRLEEEIGRAERHRTALSCLVVRIEDLGELERTHGAALPEQAIAYVGGAIQRQLRRFDRVGRPSEHELAVVLPGADQRRAEAVARRSLGRLHAVKVELDGVRRPLHVSVGIAAWREGQAGREMLAQARRAAEGTRNGEPSRRSFAFGAQRFDDGEGAPGWLPGRGRS
jgi:diguanylate cyclase (GGDEF)-like protein